MRTVESTVYTFDELSDRAKDRARDWYRNVSSSDFDDFGAETALEDAAEVCKLLGIELDTRAVPLMNGSTRREPVIYYRGFSSQGDGCSFTGCYRYRPGALQAIRTYAPQDTELHRIAAELQNLQRRNFYRLECLLSRSSSHYVHELTVSGDVSRTDDAPVSSDTEAEVIDLLRDVMRWAYRQLEREYEYQNADEQIDESIRGNEYEFTEEGDPA